MHFTQPLALLLVASAAAAVNPKGDSIYERDVAAQLQERDELEGDLWARELDAQLYERDLLDELERRTAGYSSQFQQAAIASEASKQAEKSADSLSKQADKGPFGKGGLRGFLKRKGDGARKAMLDKKRKAMKAKGQKKGKRSEIDDLSPLEARLAEDELYARQVELLGRDAYPEAEAWEAEEDLWDGYY